MNGFIPGEEVRIQIGQDAGTGHKAYQTIFVPSTNKTATIGVSTTVLTGVNTTGLTVGAAVSAIDNVIGLGVTIIGIGNTQITIADPSINTGVTTTSISIGTTSFVAYNVRQYQQEDIYDAYSDNDEFELEADNIIDFAETNPFGTY